MAARAILLASLALGLSGCLVGRTISDVVAHESYNSYKVQTRSVYWAFFSAWEEWDVWSCHRDGAVFRCKEVEYETNLQGIRRPENGPLPAEPTAAPAEPVPAPPTYPEAVPAMEGQTP